MAKYIDAEKLKYLINEIYPDAQDLYTNGQMEALNKVYDLIEFLRQEQPEVDLEEAYKEFCKDYPFPWSSQYVNREYIDELCLSVARHFYELGKNAK